MKPFDPDAAAAPGSGIFGLHEETETAQVVLLPVPFDATTSYRRGAAAGPEAILAASRQVELFDLETGRPYLAGIVQLPPSPEIPAWNQEAGDAALPVIRAGGADPGDPALAEALRKVDGIGERLCVSVREKVERFLDAGRMPCVLGGDHSVPLGAIAAYAERFPGLGILHLDAHADLRERFEGFCYSHASIMFNVCERVPKVSKLVQVGVRDVGQEEIRYAKASDGRIVTHFDPSLQVGRLSGVPWSRQVDQLIQELPERVYLSFDIDGLDPSLCPNTGTPVPGGLSFAETSALLAAVVQSGRAIVGFDLCEVAPDPERRHEWDGNVGARLLYKMIGWALRSQGKIGPP